MERLGQAHPPLRQTVVDVVCAYLRMPYLPPYELLDDVAKESNIDPIEDSATRQELQVRLTAQRFLPGISDRIT